MFLDHHIRVRNIKKEKKPRSPKVYRKNHRTITHHIQPNDRVNSPSSLDEESESTIESEYSSETPKNLISYNSYAYVAKGKRRKKWRPPKLMRKCSQRPIPSNERIKSKQTALKFDITEVEPSPRSDGHVFTPDKRKSPVNLSPKRKSPVNLSPKRKSPVNLSPREKDNSHRLALVTYSPRYIQHDDNWEDEEWSNVSEEDDFSDYHNEEVTIAKYNNGEQNESLDEGFNGEFDFIGFYTK